MLLLLQVDRDTLDMLKAINMASLPSVTMQQVRTQQQPHCGDVELHTVVACLQQDRLIAHQFQVFKCGFVKLLHWQLAAGCSWLLSIPGCG
jgi:hypothetical protein